MPSLSLWLQGRRFGESFRTTPHRFIRKLFLHLLCLRFSSPSLYGLEKLAKTRRNRLLETIAPERIDGANNIPRFEANPRYPLFLKIEKVGQSFPFMYASRPLPSSLPPRCCVRRSNQPRNMSILDARLVRISLASVRENNGRRCRP